MLVGQTLGNFTGVLLGYDLNGQLIISLTWTVAASVLITMYYIYHPVRRGNTSPQEKFQDAAIDLLSIEKSKASASKSPQRTQSKGKKSRIASFLFAGHKVEAFRMGCEEGKFPNLAGTVWTMVIEKVDDGVHIRKTLINREGDAILIGLEEESPNS